MTRTITSGSLFVLAALLAGGCTQSPEKPAAQATAAPAGATPAVQAPAAQAPAAEAPEAVDELYVDLEGEPDEGPPPLTVKWTSTVEDGTPPYTYKWDFGDGSTSSEANPTHVYKDEGEFTVTLSVTDSKGISGSEEYDVLVEKEEE